MKRKTERNIVKSKVVERSVRKAVQFPAHLITGDKKHAGFIINISARGVGMYVDTNFHGSTIDCTRGSILKLEIQSPFGKFLTLQCRIRWIRIQEHPPHSLTTSIGMEVIDPSHNFVKLFHSLF